MVWRIHTIFICMLIELGLQCVTFDITSIYQCSLPCLSVLSLPFLSFYLINPWLSHKQVHSHTNTACPHILIDNSQIQSTPLSSASSSSVLTPSSTHYHCPCACCSSMCDWWRGASIPSSATQPSSVPKAPPSFSLTCRHQMARLLPPTVNKTCNYPSCLTKGISLSAPTHTHTKTHTHTHTH